MPNGEESTYMLSELTEVLDYWGVFAVASISRYPTTIEELMEILVKDRVIAPADQADILKLSADKQLAVLATLLVKYGVVDPEILPFGLGLGRYSENQLLLFG